MVNHSILMKKRLCIVLPIAFRLNRIELFISLQCIFPFLFLRYFCFSFSIWQFHYSSNTIISTTEQILFCWDYGRLSFVLRNSVGDDGRKWETLVLLAFVLRQIITNFDEIPTTSALYIGVNWLFANMCKLLHFCQIWLEHPKATKVFSLFGWFFCGKW